MKSNKVAPWEGELIWVDNPRSGKTKKGSEWKSVDFTLKYEDEQGNERHITFNSFGVERVDKILSAPLHSTLRVVWKPESREYNGKWWVKLDAFDIIVFDGKEDKKGTELPANSPEFKQDDDDDLPGVQADLPF